MPSVPPPTSGDHDGPAPAPDPQTESPESPASPPSPESPSSPESTGAQESVQASPPSSPPEADDDDARGAPASVRPREPLGPQKRPRYLVWALIGALLFGAGCWTDGCSRLAFYRGESEQGPALNASIKSNEDRARADALYDRFTEVADAARGRAIPMAAATFVLGAALLALAARGFAGKANTRSALVQVVTAQAVVVAVSYFVLRDVQNAELDFEVERTLIHQHETMPPDRYERMIPFMQDVRRFGVPGWLVARTIASALIVLALTRQRSRVFFEAASKPVSEG